MILAATTPARPPRAFTGSIPAPPALYEYGHHFPVPFIGSKASNHATRDVDLELADEMAAWLTENDHHRPFFRDRNFIAEFGRLSKSEATAVANAMWSRADRAAAAAGTTILLPARLGGSDNTERNICD